MSASDVGLLLVAGVVAGIVGTAGGITSLVSYPALLAAGLHPLVADVVNMVALVVCWPGAAMASGPELRGRGSWLRRWSVVGVVGGVVGAVLLLSTPSSAFDRVVPFLVAGGSLALLLQPRLSRVADGRAHGSRPLLFGGIFSISAYSGYFGAGSGVMTLALMLLAADDHMARANALKNMIIGAATLAAASVLAVWGPVDWTAVLPLAAGLFVGSVIGPSVARRIPPVLLRWLVATVGLGLAVWLWVRPG